MKDLKEYKLLIFDADGTLRRCTVPGQPCPNGPSEWELMPGVIEKLQSLEHQPFLAIASNQGGVAYGFLSYAMATDLLMALAIELDDRLLVFSNTNWYMCPHHPGGQPGGRWTFDCVCRKPKPGLLYHAMMHRNVSPAQTLYVGDMDSDRQAAENAGVDFAWAWEFFGWDPPEGP